MLWRQACQSASTHELGVIYVTCSGLITTGGAAQPASEALQLGSEELEGILRGAVSYCHANGMEIAFTSPGWLDEQVFEESETCKARRAFSSQMTGECPLRRYC